MSVAPSTLRFLSVGTHGLILALGPLIAACASVRWQDDVNTFVASHPAVAPIALVALVGALLVERCRRFLLVTLCFGIGVLALKDAFGGSAIPAQIDHPVVQQVLAFAWIVIAATALLSGFGLVRRPYAQLPRTGYFVATSAYLVCNGVMGILRAGDWGSAIVLATGVAALIGVITARRPEDSAEEVDDLSANQANHESRLRAVAAREWHDSGLTTETQDSQRASSPTYSM